MDFAPAQAGAIFALTNTVANLSGFLAPQTTGHLLNVEESLSQWQVCAFGFHYLNVFVKVIHTNLVSLRAIKESSYFSFLRQKKVYHLGKI